MTIITATDFDDLSKQAFQQLLDLTSNTNNPLVCTASGDSPKGLYQHLVKAVTNKTLDIAQWQFVSLDEWAGMNGTNNGSCRNHLDNDLYHPAHISSGQVCFFDGQAADLEAECRRVENFITAHGGIDVAIVGLGVNGHVGMNEPGTDSLIGIHIAEIHPETQAIGQKYFAAPTLLDKGLTLGIASLLAAKHVLMVVSGERKAPMVKEIVMGQISDQVPATYLRQHPGFILLVDKAAATHL